MACRMDAPKARALPLARAEGNCLSVSSRFYVFIFFDTYSICFPSSHSLTGSASTRRSVGCFLPLVGIFLLLLLAVSHEHNPRPAPANSDLAKLLVPVHAPRFHASRCPRFYHLVKPQPWCGYRCQARLLSGGRSGKILQDCARTLFRRDASSKFYL